MDHTCPGDWALLGVANVLSASCLPASLWGKELSSGGRSPSAYFYSVLLSKGRYLQDLLPWLKDVLSYKGKKAREKPLQSGREVCITRGHRAGHRAGLTSSGGSPGLL